MMVRVVAARPGTFYGIAMRAALVEEIGRAEPDGERRAIRLVACALRELQSAGQPDPASAAIQYLAARLRNKKIKIHGLATLDGQLGRLLAVLLGQSPQSGPIAMPSSAIVHALDDTPIQVSLPVDSIRALVMGSASLYATNYPQRNYL